MDFVGGLSTTLAFAAVLNVSTPSRGQPVVQWVTQYGTSANDLGTAVCVDAQGQPWVGGYTEGDLGGPSAGGADTFLSRLSANGSTDFTRQRGGLNRDLSFGVALVGSSIVFQGAHSGSSEFGYDAFVQGFDTNGGFQYGRSLGNSVEDFIFGLAGNATNLLAAGATSASFDGQTYAGGSKDAFLSKRTGTGGLVWTRLAGTSSADTALGSVFDEAGNAYMAGWTFGSFDGFTNVGSVDIFVARYDSAGNRTLLKQLGTSGSDNARDVEVDASGNIYLTGYAEGPLGGEVSAGGKDAFVMKLDSSGNVLWTRLLGGASADESRGLGLDGAGHVWIGGYSDSDFAGHTNAGGSDAFVAEYDSNGVLLGTTFLSTSGNDRIFGLAIGPDDGAYVTGSTDGALGGASAGLDDVFVARVVPEPSAALLIASSSLGFFFRRRGSWNDVLARSR